MQTRLSFAYVRLLLIKLQFSSLFPCGCLWRRILNFLHLAGSYFFTHQIVVLEEGQPCVKIVTLVRMLRILIGPHNSCRALVCGQIWSLSTIRKNPLILAVIHRKRSRTLICKHGRWSFFLRRVFRY